MQFTLCIVALTSTCFNPVHTKAVLDQQAEESQSQIQVPEQRIGYDEIVHEDHHDHHEHHHEEHDPGYWKKKLTWKEGWKKVWKPAKKQVWKSAWKKIWKPVWKEIQVPAWKEIQVPAWKKV